MFASNDERVDDILNNYNLFSDEDDGKTIYVYFDIFIIKIFINKEEYFCLFESLLDII